MHTPNICEACSVTWARRGRIKHVLLCPLHAAAPDLLAACVAVLSYFDQTRHGIEWSQQGGQEAEQLRAALAKAGKE